MHEAFNPYQEWLGIQSGRRPGNHYELFGLDLYESDQAVIARAADVLTARVRRVRPGPHLPEWQRLLDTLTGAKRCLLDPTAKAAYDASLRDQTPPTVAPPAYSPQTTARPGGTPQTVAGSDISGGVPRQTPGQRVPAPAAPIPVAAPPVQSVAASPGEAPPSFPQDAPGGGFAASRAAPRRTAAGRLPAAEIAVRTLAVVLFVVAAVFAYLLYQQRRDVATSEPATAQTDPETSPAAPDGPTQRPGPQRPPHRDNGAMSPGQRRPIPGEGPKPEQQPKPEPQPEPEGGLTPEERPESAKGSGPQQAPNPEAEPEPAEGAPLDEVAALESPSGNESPQALKRAVADARFSMSEHDLAGARRHLQEAAAKAETPQQRAEVDRLDTLLGHLEAFWNGMSRVVAGLEPAEALPVGDTFVAVVEASPQELTIKVEGRLRTYQIDRLPSRLVQALANTRLAGDPATKVLVGTYLLVDPDGDPARARQLWAEAAREGVDVKDLIPELDRWAGTSSAPGPPSAQKTAPPTDQQKLQQAEQAVRERFKAEYDQAANVAGKSRLAALLLEAGRATTDEADLRFVLLREARDLAVAVGEPEWACQAIDQIAGFHKVDALGMKTAALTEAVKNARGPNAQKQVAQTALELTGQAVEARRIEEASQLAEVALLAARKSSSRTLMQQAVLVIQQVEGLQKEAQQRGNDE